MLSEVQAVVLAAAAWLGVAVGARVGSIVTGGSGTGAGAGTGGAPARAVLVAALVVVVAVVVVVLALVRRSRLLLIVGVVLVAVVAGARADAAFQPIDPGPYQGPVTAVSDPRRAGAGWRIEVALPGGERVDATGFGLVAARLASASAGDRLVVEGRLRPMVDSSWARSRHLLGRLSVDEVVAIESPGGLRALAERVRGVVAGGADRLDPERQALYLGLVIGDDRHQSLAQRARFRAAGLTHLLAVSGQNVAFVLTVAGPLIRLAPRRGRFVITVLVLVLFATVTRFEPSVLRATATAGLAAWAAVGGHPQSAVRLLALATAGLVVVDPFLVHAVGFQLSIGASAGIVVIGPLIMGRVRGPRPIVEPLAVTVAAQLGVIPLLFHYFGPVSLASLPANLAAGWAAGGVMMLGLTVGVVAGFLPARIGSWLQAPSEVLVWWLDAVAAWSARLPLPLIEPRVALVSAGLGLVIWLTARRAGPAAGRSPSGLVVVVRGVHLGAIAGLVSVAALAVPSPPAGPTELEGGGHWFPPGPGRPSVLVVAAEADEDLLDQLLAHRIGTIDLVVSEAGSGPGGRVARAVTDLVTTGVLLGPPQHRIVGATRLQHPLTVPVGGHQLLIEPGPRQLTVTISEPP